MKNLRNTLFRNKIFFALLFVTFLSLSAMAIVVFYQNYKNIINDKKSNLINVEYKVLDSYNYIIDQQNTSSDSVQFVLKSKVNELANVFNSKITLYNLNGELITSSTNTQQPIDAKMLSRLQKDGNRVLIDSISKNRETGFLSSYNFIKDQRKSKIAIVNIQSLINYSSTIYQTRVLIKQFLLLLTFLMILSGLISWYISRSITSKIDGVSQKLINTNVTYTNPPINYTDNDEIKPLVIAYNDMLDKLKEQTHLLQKTEREEAWKEMAKQVAHEINNPLTPLRLTVQNFQRKYNPEDPENPSKIKDLTQSVVHQIDLISAITKSFSDFAKMPINTDQEIDVVKTLKQTLNIFPDEIVSFTSNAEKSYYIIDSLYLTRVVTNIVKNGLQAIPEDRDKKINVNLYTDKKKLQITIEDNGNGIPEEFQEKIFQPKFTTKSSGMGLGLSMVKKIVEDYNGKIWFTSKANKGTTFYIEFEQPKTNHEE